MNPNLCSVRRLLFVLAMSMAILSGACAVLDASTAPTLESGAHWAVLPFANHTETPLAGSRAASIAEALLRSRGLADVRSASGTAQDAVFESGAQVSPAAGLDWARKEGARYVLTGSVDEWRYKVGVDGEPAVSVTLQIIDVRDGRTLWSGVGGRSGWSRESLGALAQKLIRDLLAQAMR